MVHPSEEPMDEGRQLSDDQSLIADATELERFAS